MPSDHVFLLGQSQKHGRGDSKNTGAFSMQKKLAVVVSAVIAMALPRLALAHTSNGQSSAPIQDSTAFVHWQSMGSAGPEPIQSIDGKKIPGAPNGRLAEMAKVPHAQTRALAMTQSGNDSQRVTFFNKQGDVKKATTHYAQIWGDAALGG
jgi:hypothetical protein